MSIIVSICIAAVHLLAFTKAASIPALYDLEYANQPYIEPLNKAMYESYGPVGYVNRMSVSALSGQKDGATVTRYQIEEIAANADADLPGTDGRGRTTLLQGTVTRTYTMDQGASTLHFSVPPGVITMAAAPLAIVGVVRDCALDLVKNEGACVEQYQIPYLTVFTDPAVGAVTATATSLETATFTRSLRQLHFTNAAAGPLLTPGFLCSLIFVSSGLILGASAVITI